MIPENYNYEESNYTMEKVIWDLMSGVSMKHIKKVEKMINESKEKNTLHFVEMRFLDAYEKIQDALEAGDKEIKINKRVHLTFQYYIKGLILNVQCRYNNQVSEIKITKDTLMDMHNTVTKILSFVLDNDKEFFQIYE